MEDLAAAFDSAQQTPKPPESPEEESMLKNEWMQYFANPAVSQGLMQMGAALLQPYQPGETGSGRLGAVMTQGAATIGKAAQQNYEMEQAQEEKQYKRGRDAKSDARAAADDKRAGSTLSLAERKFAYDQSQDTLNRQDAKAQLAQAAELDRLKIAAGVYEKIAQNVDPNTPQDEINRLAQEVFQQMQATTGAQSAIVNNATNQSGEGAMGVSQPNATTPSEQLTTGGQQTSGQEVTPEAPPANPTFSSQNVESFIADLKAKGVREKIHQQYGAGATAVMIDEVRKFPKEVRQRMLDYFVKGI